MNTNRKTGFCNVFKNLQHFCVRYFREGRHRRSHVNFKCNNSLVYLRVNIINPAFTCIFTSHAAPEAVINISLISDWTDFFIEAIPIPNRWLAAAWHIDNGCQASSSCRTAAGCKCFSVSKPGIHKVGMWINTAWNN